MLESTLQCHIAERLKTLYKMLEPRYGQKSALLGGCPYRRFHWLG